ncbi:response regulator [Paraburkholderia sp. UCT31]|uniref:response regulator n=1 Tax=Paraburkholderia sp. UCT31 TaxID=2615209 RepID=UPI00223B21AF|nr:response regulator [Paraburkholderia sp. UCT31]
MDGYALARCLRDQSATVPIIAITAQVGAEERSRCKKVGIDEVLLKPVLLGTLDATVRRLVKEAGKRPASDTAARLDVSHARTSGTDAVEGMHVPRGSGCRARNVR